MANTVTLYALHLKTGDVVTTEATETAKQYKLASRTNGEDFGYSLIIPKPLPYCPRYSDRVVALSTTAAYDHAVRLLNAQISTRRSELQALERQLETLKARYNTR